MDARRPIASDRLLNNINNKSSYYISFFIIEQIILILSITAYRV
ncbi:hypothetical protein VPHK469_0058 [Vibrio phage K469]